MLNKFMRVALVCLGAAMITGCYHNATDRASTQARLDFYNQEALLEKQSQEAVSTYRSKFSSLDYHYTVRLYKTELMADNKRVKTGESIQEFSIHATGGEIAEFRYDGKTPSADDKPLGDDELLYVGQSSYGAEYNLTPEAAGKRPGSIEFKIDPNHPSANGRVKVSFITRRNIGVAKASCIEPQIISSGRSSVTVGFMRIALQSKDRVNLLREGKAEFAVDNFFVELEVTASGSAPTHDVI